MTLISEVVSSPALFDFFYNLVEQQIVCSIQVGAVIFSGLFKPYEPKEIYKLRMQIWLY